MMNFPYVIRFLLPLLVASRLLAVDISCAPLSGASQGEIFDYLRQHSPTEKSACIDNALDVLTKSLDKDVAMKPPINMRTSDVELLVAYLAHERTVSEAERVYQIRQLTAPRLYPAINSVYLLRGRAVAPLINLLSENLDAVTRRNGEYALALIFNDHFSDAISALRLRHEQAKSWAERDRLRKVIEEFTRDWCHSSACTNTVPN